MKQIAIDPELSQQGLIVCGLEVTPTEPSPEGRLAYRRLFDETLAELQRRAAAQTIPTTISALIELQRRYCGRSKPIDPIDLAATVMR